MTLFPTRTAVVAVALLGPFVAAGAQTMPPTELLEALKQGGHVIYIRHASTESDYADQITADPGNCATQRVLSEAGWAQAKAIGAALAEVPVGAVVSSEYCRAWQTADLAFGQYDKNPALNFEPAEEYSEDQVAAMRARVLPLVSALPDAGTNRVIVGHDDPFEAVTGIYPEPQGVAYVLRPDGAGGFDLLGHVAPDDWPQG